MSRTIEEVMKELERRRKQYEALRKRRKRNLLRGGAVLIGCLAVVLLVGRARIFSPNPPDPVAPPNTSTLSDPNRQKRHDLMTNIRPMSVTNRETDDEFTKVQTAFAIDMFRAAVAENRSTLEKNRDGGVLVSPISAQFAFAMLANGATGETLRQMEEVLGNGIPIAQLNEYLHTFTANLPNEKNAKIDFADSIWFCDTFAPNQTFLQTNADYYGAAAYQAPADALCGFIDQWVRQQTEGTTDPLFDEMAEKTVMALVSSVNFHGSWKEPFGENSVRISPFMAYGGSVCSVPMMQSKETIYLEDADGTIGFMKPYENERYAFAAILPDENTDIFDYIEALTAEKFVNLLDGRVQKEISVQLPKFSFTNALDLTNIMTKLGMSDAFSESCADFAGLSMEPLEKQNLFLNQATQNATIVVSENGTKAASTTGIDIGDTSLAFRFNRPFVYMILDTQTNIPLLLGMITDMHI